MPSTYVADRFRGSGSVHNSAPDEKHASVGNWTIYGVGEFNPGPPTEDSQQNLKRSDGGLTAQWSSTDTLTPLIRAAGEVTLGAGVFVAEIKANGQFLVSVRLNSFASAAMVFLYDGTIQTQFGSTNSFASISRPRSLQSVTRIEIEPEASQVRMYVDGVLIDTRTSSAPVSVSSVQVFWDVWSTVATRFGPAVTAVDYVNVKLNATSGPLGAPSTPVTGAGTLPALTADGGEFRRGDGAATLEALTSEGGVWVLAPAFWDRLVRAHERR